MVKENEDIDYWNEEELKNFGKYSVGLSSNDFDDEDEDYSKWWKIYILLNIPYSNFTYFKTRPVLVFKELENDFLFLPLISNLKREGILLRNLDLIKGNLKKDSVVVVPKITAIYKNIILKSRFFATLSDKKFNEIEIELCKTLECKGL